MARMRPFRFLADVHEIVTGRELAARARRAEQLGYHALVLPDHLIGQLSPVVTMATVAAATSTLRVSAFVLNNDLRHPAVLAQDLASIDVLSEEVEVTVQLLDFLTGFILRNGDIGLRNGQAGEQ